MFRSNWFYVTLLIQCALVEIYCGLSKHFFRKDYVLLELLDRTEAFYKIHPEWRTWHAAKEICEAEGANLFYPNDEKEAKAVIHFWNHTFDFKRIFIGISTPYSKDIFETVDGRLMADVYDKWRLSQPDDRDGNDECVVLDRDGYLSDFAYESRMPFVCKKTLSSLDWNVHCDIPDNAYKYEASLSRCYKFHSSPKKWSDAYAVCRMEQSYLAIINSDAEAKYLALLVNSTDVINDVDYTGVVHLGFKKTNGWKTTLGTGVPLRTSGYKKWAKGQPDGGPESICGSMLSNAQLNDINCDEKAMFICEHEISLLKYDLDFRFGEDK